MTYEAILNDKASKVQEDPDLKMMFGWNFLIIRILMEREVQDILLGIRLSVLPIG